MKNWTVAIAVVMLLLVCAPPALAQSEPWIKVYTVDTYQTYSCADLAESEIPEMLYLDTYMEPSGGPLGQILPEDTFSGLKFCLEQNEQGENSPTVYLDIYAVLYEDMIDRDARIVVFGDEVSVEESWVELSISDTYSVTVASVSYPEITFEIYADRSENALWATTLYFNDIDEVPGPSGLDLDLSPSNIFDTAGELIAALMTVIAIVAGIYLGFRVLKQIGGRLW